MTNKEKKKTNIKEEPIRIVGLKEEDLVEDNEGQKVLDVGYIKRKSSTELFQFHDHRTGFAILMESKTFKTNELGGMALNFFNKYEKRKQNFRTYIN